MKLSEIKKLAHQIAAIASSVERIDYYGWARWPAATGTISVDDLESHGTPALFAFVATSFDEDDVEDQFLQTDMGKELLKQSIFVTFLKFGEKYHSQMVGDAIEVYSRGDE